MLELISLALALVTVPFTVFDNRMLVQSTLNGESGFAMIVDTGASGISITPEVARRLRLKVRAAGSIAGAGAGRLPIWSGELREIALSGGRHFGRHTVTIVDLSAIRRAFGFPRLDGIIGYDLFASNYLLVDNDRRVFEISQERIDPPREARRTRFTLGADGLLHMSGAVDGVHGDMILDTGDRSEFTLFERFGRTNGFDQNAPVARNVLTGYGIGGPIRADVTKTHLDVLGFHIDNVRTRLPIGNAGVFSVAGGIGSVGNGLLKRFNVLYDNVAHVMSVWPSRAFADSPTQTMPVASQLPRHAVFGAVLSETRGAPAVTRVVPKSAAAAAGVSPGDVIVSIGNVRTPSVASFLAEMHRLRAGERTTLTFTHRGGPQGANVVLGAPANENDPAVTTLYGAIQVDGSLRRTLLTYPKSASGSLPAVLLLGGIGCYSVDAAANPEDPYMRLAHDISRAGFVTMRIEKSGVGDSQGPPCNTVDFAAEERGYAAALTALRADPHVDSSRVFLLGHSIGSLEAPRLASVQHVAGIIVSEAVGRDWPEYEVRNLRRQLELGGASPPDTDTALMEKQQCLVQLLYEKWDEATIERSMPSCKTHNGVYPVDPPYMQQVAAVNVIETWSKVDVPVLAVYGTSDFVTEEADHRRIVDVVNAGHPSTATYAAINGMDHYLFAAPSAKASLQLVSSGAARKYDTDLSTVVVHWLSSKTQLAMTSGRPIGTQRDL